jgi:hypothetical protein
MPPTWGGGGVVFGRLVIDGLPCQCTAFTAVRTDSRQSGPRPTSFRVSFSSSRLDSREGSWD